MEAADVEKLSSPSVRELVASLPPYDDGTALATGERLRAAGHSADLVSAVLTQSRLRTKTRPRWGNLVDRLVLTPDGAEQGTRPVVAEYRATRFVGAGVKTIVDLGCGLGLDALAMAEAGLTIVGVERDPLTAAAAHANAAALGVSDRFSVVCADARTLDLGSLAPHVDAVFADPARRRDGRRISHPEGWSPPLSWLLDLRAPSLGVKVAPGLRLDVLPESTEFEVVSVNGAVVEGGLYRGQLSQQDVQRRATLLPSGATVTDHDLPTESPVSGPVGNYLHEPDGAVIRSGLVGVVVQQLGGRLIDPSIAYVTTDADVRSELGHTYEVFDVMPFSLKRLRSHLRERGVGRVTVKKRGSAIEPDTLRRQLRLERGADGEVTVFLTRVDGKPTVVVASQRL